MGKVNVQCFMLKEGAPYFVPPQGLEANVFRPATAGAESSMGFSPASPDGESLAWGIGTHSAMYRIAIETRKPSAKLVKQFARKRMRELADQENIEFEEFPKARAAEVTEAVRLELWGKMDGDVKYVWVRMAMGMLYVFAKGPVVERVTGLLRRAIGTLPSSPRWQGREFHLAALDYLYQGNTERAHAEGLDFKYDLCLKAGTGEDKKLVKLEGHDDLSSPTIREHLTSVQNFESVGATHYESFFTVTPYGLLTFEQPEAQDVEEETELASECADALLASHRAVNLAAAVSNLCAQFDTDIKVEIPLP